MITIEIEKDLIASVSLGDTKKAVEFILSEIAQHLAQVDLSTTIGQVLVSIQTG